MTPPTEEDLRIKMLRANGREDLAKQLEREIVEVERNKELERIRKITNGPVEIKPTNAQGWLDRFITQDSEMLKVKEQVKILMHIEDPVLITGPSGTGKEILARALHGNRLGDWIGINCAGLPENLVESELFGHVKGAFTGASVEKQGILSAASGGTVFLDEIGDLPMMAQSKLLRAIQERQIRKVGGNVTENISCRIIGATWKELEGTSNFREDLYWRLSTFELKLSSLKKRGWMEIELILDSIDKDKKVDRIELHHMYVSDGDVFKGNVRALQRMVRRYQVLGYL
ncbi:MAG TPA: sigma-54 factor interaction domain-containing protein [Nitrososphaeraceae archaeon]|jgi:transcriptional regulator with PAS, ATPase and Fis domain|nr:sigma-54 factor interaction domain-containing protein [Nitrososphaeraceae archaeon]